MLCVSSREAGSSRKHLAHRNMRACVYHTLKQCKPLLGRQQSPLTQPTHKFFLFNGQETSPLRIGPPSNFCPHDRKKKTKNPGYHSKEGLQWPFSPPPSKGSTRCFYYYSWSPHMPAPHKHFRHLDIQRAAGMEGIHHSRLP